MGKSENLALVLSERVKVANMNKPADLILLGARVVDFISKNIIDTNIAVSGGYIAAIGREYKEAREIIDLQGGFVTPGLIDAHLHIESTLLYPPALAEVLIAHGTTSVISDPHEIANVMGLDGVLMMLEAASGLSCDFFMTAPSCVPATEMETAGGEINLHDLKLLLNHPGVIGLGEMMNYPGVVDGDPQVFSKIAAAHQAGKVVDGHAPGLRGTTLQSYIAAGISTDHETITAEEAREKLAAGMKIIIRHGSASSSLSDLLPLVNDSNVNSFMFGSDDREAGELIEKGHFNDLLREAVKLGADPFLAIRMATHSAASHYRLADRGLIAPGFRADLAVFKDLENFETILVLKEGQVTAQQGRAVHPTPQAAIPSEALNRVHLKNKLAASDFVLHGLQSRMPVIGVIPGQLLTEKLIEEVKINRDGMPEIDPETGLNKIAVVERHKGSGRLSVALVRGLDLREGAIASSVAHDSHNIIVAGVQEEAMAVAVNQLASLGGGFVVVGGDGKIKASLPLVIGGLMSDKPAVKVAGEMRNLLAASADLGTKLSQPFLTLSFLALPVIPSLKITDRGLFDVDNFSFI